MAAEPTESGSRRLGDRARLFAGTARQDFWLTASCLSFFAVYALYNLSFFYRVDLQHYAAHDVFAYRPTGLLAADPWKQLVAHPWALAFVQYGFSMSCLVATVSLPSLIQRLILVSLGYFYFGILNGYVRETNIEYLAFLVLLAFALAPERPRATGSKAFSPSCLLLWLLLAMLYANSAATHAMNYERWLTSGLALKNLFLAKLSTDANWTPFGTSALMTQLVVWLPDWVFWAMGVSTIAFDASFWMCLFFRGPRLPFLAFGFLFHLSCILLMNIVFAPIFPVYVGLALFELLDPERVRTTPLLRPLRT